MSWNRSLLLISLVPAVAWAQTEIVESRLYYSAEPGTGNAYRKDVGKATTTMLQGDVDTAMPLLQPALAYCDAQRSQPGRRAMSFSSRREYAQYMADAGNGEPTEWLDIACAMAYQQAGYGLAQLHRFEEALRLLDTAIAVGPYYPSAWTEKGFVLNQLGRPAEALDAYNTALELGRSHTEAAYIQPMALRGIGFSRTELKDLDGARAAYEQSLQLEPGNSTALHELDYIAQQQHPAPVQATP